MKLKRMMTKLELYKAYDRPNWPYIFSILHAFGFDPRWINWISYLISSPVISILLNGYPTKTFSPSQGILQGDRLYPFLLILEAEGFERYIK